MHRPRGQDDLTHRLALLRVVVLCLRSVNRHKEKHDKHAYPFCAFAQWFAPSGARLRCAAGLADGHLPNLLRSVNVPQMEQTIGRRRKTGKRVCHASPYAG